MSRPAVGELLAAFGEVMRARGLRWYVFGAQAVLAHGRPRLTADVDVAVELTGIDPAGLVALLDAAGIALGLPLSPERLREARLLPMVHLPTEIPVDLVITGPGFDEELLDRARPADLGGVAAPVVSPEDLVAMKVLAGRRKDLEDVRGILAQQQGRLDLARTREVLAAFEQADPDRRLLARFERLLHTRSGAPTKRRRRR